jgi:hypothetical protein
VGSQGRIVQKRPFGRRPSVTGFALRGPIG